MGERLFTQLGNLERERERLEELLMLDANWRALRELELREASGRPVEAVEDDGLKRGLLAALAGNRLFAARAKLIETIELLSTGPTDAATAHLPSMASTGDGPRFASRIVLLSQPGDDSFRARVRMKPAAQTLMAEAPVEETVVGHAGEAEVSPSPGQDEAASLGATNQPAEIVAAAITQPPPSARAIATRVPDALELIDGLGRSAVEELLEAGVTRFAEVAGWSSGDAMAWQVRLDGLAVGHPLHWIEQAAVLSSGRDTRYAVRVRRGEFAALAPVPPPEPPRPVEPVAAVPVAASDIALLEAVAPVVSALPEAEPERPSSPPPQAVARLVSAEELAIVLEVGPPLRAAGVHDPAQADGSAAGDVERIPALSKLSLRRRGFARPVHTARFEADASEVVVVPRAPEEVASTFPEPSPRAADRTPRLLRRLKQVEPADQFSADAYAAYRGEVEEASVTIVRADAAPPVASPGTVEDRQPGGPADKPIHRFLKALTGKP